MNIGPFQELFACRRRLDTYLWRYARDVLDFQILADEHAVEIRGQVDERVVHCDAGGVVIAKPGRKKVQGEPGYQIKRLFDVDDGNTISKEYVGPEGKVPIQRHVDKQAAQFSGHGNRLT